MSAGRTRALPFRVLVITDEHACGAQRRGVIETIARALAGARNAGDVAVLVRAKHRPLTEVRETCAALRAITTKAGARLLVHTHVELVDELDLDGAHVEATAPGDALAAARAHMKSPRAILGASRHANDALDENALAALDYVTLSPIFSPTSKANDTRDALGVGALASSVAKSARPIVALGGIDDTRAASCMRTGARAVAVIGAVMSAHDPQRALRSLRDAAQRTP